MLVVFGSTAIDTIRTPTKILRNVLGGAATFAGISASFFVKTGLIAVVGTDFPKKYHKILSQYLDLSGLVIETGLQCAWQPLGCHSPFACRHGEATADNATTGKRVGHYWYIDPGTTNPRR